MAMQLISQAEYAKRRGVSQVAVHKAVKAGRITLIEGKIDPVVANVQWQANTRARINPKSTPEDVGDARGLADSDDGNGYWASRARREQAEAELAELELAKLRRLLVLAADVRAALAKKLASVREGFLQMASRLVPLLVVEADPAKLDALLRQEIHGVLAQLTAGSERRSGAAQTPPAGDESVDSGSDDGDNYWTSRAQREQAEAELAELKLAKLRGLLVLAADVRAALAKKLASVREGFLQLPSRLVPLLVVEADPAKLDALLRQEIHGVLAQLTAGD